MVKKILVALDSSEYSAELTKCAAFLSRSLGASVTGVHVVDIVALEGPLLHDIAGSIGFEPFHNFSKKMREFLEAKGRGVLDSFSEELEAEGIECDTRLLTGIVPNEISSEAKLFDLLLIGRRGANLAFEHGMLGSAAEAVVRKSPKPVLVVDKPFAEPKRPLLAYDGGERAARCMHSAAEFAVALSIPLTVLVVAAEGPEADRLLKGADDYLKPYGVETEFVRRDGPPEDAILAHYTEGGHDLLFMGSTHHSRIVELVLGSTIETVLRLIDGPLFLER